jgi:hypothetical protein
MKKFWRLVDSGHINSKNFQAFLRDPNQGDLGVIEHELLLGSDVVSRNVKDAKYEGYVNPAINDDNYPVSGEGVVKVRYHLISGEKLKRADGWVYRDDFKVYCRERSLREPNAGEATLLPVKDKQIGRGAHPLVAFIGGSRAAFIVSVNYHARILSQNIDLVKWSPVFEFLAVCE